ncbi:MAG: diacylglycerol kinase family lipid kinase [Proteobacteria bacterium]|nr:diacylglycerol kinase family lipid kinase [Pseudomonadota bacterium]
MIYPGAMPARYLVIVNPASRNGATGRRWRQVEAKLRDALGSLEVEQTRGPRDAERIAREAVRAGVERLVVAGGDGTTSEVASGLLAADLASYAQVGVLPLGTGGDLARVLELPRDLGAAIEGLARGNTRRIDAGRITFLGNDGKQQTQFFLNVASFGISGLVAQLVNRAPKALGGTLSFLIGTLRGIARYRPQDVMVRIDGRVVHRGPVVLAAAANGRYFGGGMQIAPDARPDDAQLDLVLVEGVGKLALLSRFPPIYRGRHLADPAVSVHRGVLIEADAAPGEVWLEVDGEPLGSLPATIELLPGALTLFGMPA